MKKKIILSLIIIILLVIGIAWYKKMQLQKVVSLVIPIPPPVTSENNTALLEKHPFDFQEYFKNEKKTLPTIKTLYGTLSFPLLIDLEHTGGRNPAYGIVLSGRKIGETSGQGFSMNSFSPDERYYAFRTRGTIGCAGMCQDTGIDVIDLKDKKVIDVQYPKEAIHVEDFDRMILNDYIESFLWKNSYILTVTTFSNLIGEKESYRISPKQVWDYNLNTKEYTLITQN